MHEEAEGRQERGRRELGEAATDMMEEDDLGEGLECEVIVCCTVLIAHHLTATHRHQSVAPTTHYHDRAPLHRYMPLQAVTYTHVVTCRYVTCCHMTVTYMAV